jgi:hypothetical protein
MISDKDQQANVAAANASGKADNTAEGFALVEIYDRNCEKLDNVPASLQTMTDVIATLDAATVRAGQEQAWATYQKMGQAKFCMRYKAGAFGSADGRQYVETADAMAANAVSQSRIATAATQEKSYGDLQIQFRRWGIQSGLLSGVVMMKNLTDIDFATVSWACEFYEEGYKVGVGHAVFHVVPKKTVAMANMSFYSNSRTADVDIKCQLSGIEKRTRENERLYSAFILQNNPLDFEGWVRGKPHGGYTFSSAQSGVQ